MMGISELAEGKLGRCALLVGRAPRALEPSLTRASANSGGAGEMSESSTIDRIVGLRILAVDDEPDILETIVDVLDGATVDSARSYQEAMALLNLDMTGIMYDLAILDIMGVDGMDLLTQTTNRKIPTVMLTAHAMNPETLRASITGGALSYLPKEELANLAEHISDVLEAVERGQSTWERLFNRIGGFFERAFAPGWKSGDPEFWGAYYGPVM
jgi:CheY-like chemotaxis protein